MSGNTVLLWTVIALYMAIVISAGIYYSRFTHKGSLVYFHKFGTRPSSDTLLFGREFHSEHLPGRRWLERVFDASWPEE